MKRRAFTLIEMLIVVGLIALLGTILIMAVGKMQTSGKRQQTHLILTNLQAMYSEYDASHRQSLGAGNLNPSFYSTTIVNALSLPCPGDVTQTDRTRYAVQLTRYFMAQLLQNTTNASAIGKLPSGSLMTFVGQNASVLYPGLGPWANTTAYNICGAATDSFGNAYIRTRLYLDTDGHLLEDGQRVYNGIIDPTFKINSPPNNYFWMPALVIPAGSTTPLPTPVVLDAWGNPIIFVMGGVLGNGAPLAANGTVTAGSGAMLAGGITFQQHSPDYHPFFASAGPDGDFSKGDDNLYSFEK